MLNQAEKMEKRVMGNMRYDRELEMLLSEIPRQQNNHHHSLLSASPVISSSSSGGSSSLADSFSPYAALMDQTVYRTPNSSFMDCRSVKNSSELFDELGLCETLRRMSICGLGKDHSQISRQFWTVPERFESGECSFDGIRSNGFQNYSPFEGFRSDVHGHGYEGFQPSVHGNSTISIDDLRANLLGFGRGYNAGNLIGSNLSPNHSSPLYSDPISYGDKIDHVLDQRRQLGRGSSNGGGGLQMPRSPSMSLPSVNDESQYMGRNGMNFNGDMVLLNPENISQSVYPSLPLNAGSPLCNSYMLNERGSRGIPNGRASASFLSMPDAEDVEAFSYEDSLIIQGKSLKCVVDKRCDRAKGQKKKPGIEIAAKNRRQKRQDPLDRSQLQGYCESGMSPRSFSPLLSQMTPGSLSQVQGNLYFMAKDQIGCRFLQKMIDEGTSQEVQIIFSELICHVVELMVNAFGNYLIQKLLEVCNEEQRTQIVLMVTVEPGDIVRISLNTHGTRVVQKLIETLKTRQQISLVVSALQPGFLNLIKDLNGNHVIQRCLQFFSKEDNKFIFDAAAKFCVEIATHQHGCCVLNRCIGRSVGKYQEKLVAEIASHGFLLAQDAYGNYVIQYIIELKIPSAATSLISQFEGHFVYLATQKFSSHVVEKCLSCHEESHPIIIHELLSVPHFEQLLQDPFANYVISSALQVTKGTLHDMLVEAVRPHTLLRTSPYCKKIFSSNLLKK